MRSIASENSLSDNERNIVFVAHYLDYKRKEAQIAITARSFDEFYQQFLKFAGNAILLGYERMTESEYKEEVA